MGQLDLFPQCSQTLPPCSPRKRQVCPADCRRAGTAKQTRTDHAAQDMILTLGDPIKDKRFGIHTLHPPSCLPADKPMQRVEAVASEGAASSAPSTSRPRIAMCGHRSGYANQATSSMTTCSKRNGLQRCSVPCGCWAKRMSGNRPNCKTIPTTCAPGSRSPPKARILGMVVLSDDRCLNSD